MRSEHCRYFFRFTLGVFLSVLGYALGQTPKRVAHRGGCALGPENTLATIQKGIEAGAAFIELDIHLSKDSILVVSHDETVDRCTNGHGRISEMSWNQLRVLDAGGWYSSEFQGEKLPTLAEVLAFTQGKVGLWIEIKGYGKEYSALPALLVETLHQYPRVGPVQVISFDSKALRAVHELDSTLALQQLLVSNLPLLPFYLDRRLHWGSPKKLDFVQSLGYFHRAIGPSQVKKVHGWGKNINAWTVNSPKRISKLAQMGVDAITTNDPRAFSPIEK